MTKGISKESNEGLDTFGKIAYQKYGIKGARFEAEEGFTSVQQCLKKFSLDNEKSYYEALCYLISHIDDTVLLKRCNNIQNYLNTKLMFEDVKYDKEKIKMISNYCIENNLSFGGSADLFIVLILSFTAFIVTLLYDVPVEYLPEGFYPFSAGIAVVYVIGVLPYVDSEQRVLTVGERSACILCADNIQLSFVVAYKPHPS